MLFPALPAQAAIPSGFAALAPGKAGVGGAGLHAPTPAPLSFGARLAEQVRPGASSGLLDRRGELSSQSRSAGREHQPSSAAARSASRVVEERNWVRSAASERRSSRGVRDERGKRDSPGDELRESAGSAGVAGPDSRPLGRDRDVSRFANRAGEVAEPLRHAGQAAGTGPRGEAAGAASGDPEADPAGNDTPYTVPADSEKVDIETVDIETVDIEKGASEMAARSRDLADGPGAQRSPGSDGALTALVNGSIQFSRILAANASTRSETGPEVFGPTGGTPEDGSLAAESEDPAPSQGNSETQKHRILCSVPRETLNQNLHQNMPKVVHLDEANVLPDTHASVESLNVGHGAAGDDLSLSFDGEKTNQPDLGSALSLDDSQKFPQAVTVAVEAKEVLPASAQEANGPPEAADSETAAAELGTNAAGTSTGPAEVDSNADDDGGHEQRSWAVSSGHGLPRQEPLEADSRPAASVGGSELAAPDATAGFTRVGGGDRTEAWPREGAAPNSEPSPAAEGRGSPEGGRAWATRPAQPGLVPELEKTAVQLQIEAADSGLKNSNDTEEPRNEFDSWISSSRANGKPKVLSQANDPGSAPQTLGPEGVSAARDAIAEKGYAALQSSLPSGSEVGSAAREVRHRGAEGSLDLVRPVAAPNHATGAQNAPETQASLASGSAFPGRANPSFQVRAEADGASEASGRFVRAATLANELGAQRMNVVMQDDQLGRISLRLVDRAGLIQAVVRTDGARAAHLISESLPVLLESLSQRGLSASWTSSQGQGYDQQNDPRQGQPRRQRQSGGQGSGNQGRRAARGGEAVFRVEVR